MPSRTTLILLHKEAKNRVFLQGTVARIQSDPTKSNDLPSWVILPEIKQLDSANVLSKAIGLQSELSNEIIITQVIAKHTQSLRFKTCCAPGSKVTKKIQLLILFGSQALTLNILQPLECDNLSHFIQKSLSRTKC